MQRHYLPIKTACKAAVLNFVALNFILLPDLFAQGTPPPMLLLKDAQGATVNTLCLDSAPATLQVTGGETILEATVLGSSGACPPGDFVQIISFGVAADNKTAASTNLNFDISAPSNCSVGAFTRCLFFSWETLPGFNVPNPSCTIALQGTPAIVQPVTIFNPSLPPNFSNAPAAEILSFAALQNQPPGYAWPLSAANPPQAGTSREFLMTCNGMPQQQASVMVNFIDGATPPRLRINNNETAAVTVNFGTATQGAQAPTQTVTLQNPALAGAPAATVTSITAPAAPFSRVSGTGGGTCAATFPITLNAGQSCTIVYQMATATVNTFNQNLTVATNAPPTTRTLTLTGTVSAGGGGGAADCSNRPPVVPTRDTTQTEFWQLLGTDNSVVWPGPNGSSRVLVVKTNQYKALRFDTSQTSSDVLAGEYSWEKNSVGNPFAAAVVSLSECPGEVRPPDPNCSAPLPQNPFSTGSIKWVMEGAVNPPPADRCILKLNTVYYVNTIFGQSANPTVTSCPSQTACQHLVRIAHVTQ